MKFLSLLAVSFIMATGLATISPAADAPIVPDATGTAAVWITDVSPPREDRHSGAPYAAAYINSPNSGSSANAYVLGPNLAVSATGISAAFEQANGQAYATYYLSVIGPPNVMVPLLVTGALTSSFVYGDSVPPNSSATAEIDIYTQNSMLLSERVCSPFLLCAPVINQNIVFTRPISVLSNTLVIIYMNATASAILGSAGAPVSANASADPYFQFDPSFGSADQFVMVFSQGIMNVPISVDPPAVEDADGDGVPDNVDQCPNSDLSATVVIDGCNSRAENDLFTDGCTISDLVTKCLEGSSNRIRALLCTTRLTRDLKRDGAISVRETTGILGCTVRSLFP